MLEYNAVLQAQERYKQLVAESLVTARLRAQGGELPLSRPVYAPLLARLGAMLVAAGATLRARYGESSVFADEGAPEGVALIRSLR